MNKTILLGRITKDLTPKFTANGNCYLQFTLAIDRGQNSNGEKLTDFVPCVAWRKTAEIISQYCSKGSKIAVEGSIQTRTYDADGKKNYVVEVLVDRFEFCESKRYETEDSAHTEVREPNPPPRVKEGNQIVDAVPDVPLPFEI